MSAYLDAGKKYLTLNRLDEAEACFRKLINSNRELGDAYYGLGLVQMGRNDSRGARENFTRAIAADPDNVNALLRLADMAVAAGDKAKAIELYEKVLTKKPGTKRAESQIEKLVGSTGGSATSSRAGRNYAPIWKDSFVGEVHDLTTTTEPWRGRLGAIKVLRFRVVAYDANDRPLPPVVVEMRGDDISGLLKEGDFVEIGKRPRRGKTLSPKRVHNLKDDGIIERTWRTFGTIIRSLGP